MRSSRAHRQKENPVTDKTTEHCPYCGDAVLCAPMLSANMGADAVGASGRAIPVPVTGYQCGSGSCDWFVIRPEGNTMTLKSLLAAALA
jgi:hypothetical protein